MPTRLIFLNRFFYPDHSATSQMLSDLAFALAKRGHQVTVITSRLRYDDHNIKLPANEQVRGVKIVRVATTGFGRGNLIGRTIDYLTFYISVAYALARQARRGDIVICKTDPPMLSLVAAPIAWLKRAYFVNWLQDIFPEVAQALGVGQRGLAALGFSIARRLRDQTLKRADFNVVLGERMAEKVTELGVSADKIHVIANWADGSSIKPVPADQNSMRDEWCLNGCFVVGYSGNLGRAHDINTFIDAITMLEQQTDLRDDTVRDDSLRDDTVFERPAIRWLFIGGGARTGNLQNEVAKRGLRSVQFRPYQPRERLAESLSAADVHLVSLQPELEGLIVPSKYYGIAAAGRGLIFIGDKDGEIARLITKSKTGLVISQGDGEGLARAVRALGDDSVGTAHMGAKARQLFEAKHDLPLAVASWGRALNKLQIVQGE